MKNYSNDFLSLWMKCNPEFWAELKAIEKELILDLVVSGKTIKELSKLHQVSRSMLIDAIAAILVRIERLLGPELANAIRSELGFIESIECYNIAPIRVQNFILN